MLSEFVDQELAIEELAAVRGHLCTCKRCSEESARLVNLKKAVGAWDGITGGEEFRTKVVECFVRESQMLQGKDFGTAADEARNADEFEPRSSGPPVWLLLAAGVLAVGMYLLLQWLRK
jgi:anti-sigma factor RsiW